MGYPGGKGLAWRTIISQMPPHDLYIEGCLGHGIVLRSKRPAAVLDVGIDSDLVTCREARAEGVQHVVCGDVIDLVPSLVAAWRSASPPAAGKYSSPATAWPDPNAAAGEGRSSRVLLYVDPPYLAKVRTKQAIYRHELRTVSEHRHLVMMLLTLPCYVMLSGYRSAEYDRWLRGWRRLDYSTGTRGGGRIESLWMNFPVPAELHDVRFVGQGFRERERIKRKRARWVSRLTAMGPAERQVIREALATVEDQAVVDRPSPRPARVPGSGTGSPSLTVMATRAPHVTNDEAAGGRIAGRGVSGRRRRRA